VVEHCNLSCRSCSHLSPVVAKRVVDPADVERDLSVLARHYRAKWVRLLGGEPLLHPDLLGVVDAVRRSGVAERIMLVTNGVRLPRVPSVLWASLDAVQVSQYPGHSLSSDALAECRSRARENCVSLWFREIDSFRESYSELGTSDDALVRRIYDSCEVAHKWQCHTVADGHFFKCGPSVFLHRTLPEALGDLRTDGVDLADSDDLGRRLREYLESPDPLVACRNCLGTSGFTFAHEQVRRVSFRGLQNHRTEEMVDHRLLEPVAVTLSR